MTPVAGEKAPAEAGQAPSRTIPVQPAPSVEPRKSANPTVWITAAFVVLALTYLAVVPPFESPDENSHYEYARLLRELGRGPTFEDRSETLRAEVERYMLEREYGLLLPAPGGAPRLGFNDELQRQPATYYWLPALLGRLAPTDLESHLRAMRLASIALGVVVVLASARVGQLLFPESPFARVALPLLVASTPGFAFISASVNNDNLANAGAAIGFVGLALAVRRGITPQALLLVVGGLALGVAGKRTPVALVPPTLLALYWIAVMRARWPLALRLALSVLPLAALGFVARSAFDGGGRASGWQVERAGDVSRVEEGLFGTSALRIAPGVDGAPGRLRQVLGTADVARAAEAGMTAHVWVRAADATAAPAPKVRLQIVEAGTGPAADRVVDDVWRPLRVQHRPRAGATVALVLTVEGESAALVDGVVVALGERQGLPEADGATMVRGQWAGAPFANLAANGSAEQADREVAPWLAPVLEPIGAKELLVASTDLERLRAVPGPVLEHRFWFVWQSYLGRFGWLVLPMPDPTYEVVLAVAAFGLLGALSGLLSRRWAGTVALLLFVGGCVVAAATLPFLGGGLGAEWPQGRYLYIAIIPLSALVAFGLGRFIPARLAPIGIAAVAAGALALNAVALLGTILPRYAGAT